MGRFCWGTGRTAGALPPWRKLLLQRSVWVVIPLALLLMGMRLSQLKGWDSLKRAVVPAVLKMLILPGAVGGVAIASHLPAEACLVLVLMSGMPSAFAGPHSGGRIRTRPGPHCQQYCPFNRGATDDHSPLVGVVC